MSSDFSLYYDHHIQLFSAQREAMLKAINSAIPNSVEIHKREWKVQQLENATTDLKSTIAAFNIQLDLQRAKLDEFRQIRDQKKIKRKQLMEDAILLQGVTGIHANLPADVETNELHEINTLSKKFKDNFTEFSFSLPPLPTDIFFDQTLQQDSDGLTKTLNDYISAQFDTRHNDAQGKKEEYETRKTVNELKKIVKEEENKLEHQIRSQKHRVEESARRIGETIHKEVNVLKEENSRLVHKIQEEQERVELKLSSLKLQEERLKSHISSLKSQNQSIQENFRRKAKEIEQELDRFERKIRLIKKHPSIIDQQLINTSLVLTKKSNKIFKAIHSIREELASFNSWILSLN